MPSTRVPAPRRVVCVAALALGVAALVPGAGCRKRPAPGRARQARPYKGLRIDVHAHLSRRSLGRALALLDGAGIEHVINLSGGFPGRGLEESLAAAAGAGGRISVMCNLPFGAFARVPDFVPRAVALLERCKRLGAVGLKIPKGLGLVYRDPAGRLLAVDDPRLDPVFQAAGRLKLPIAIHTGDPKAFWEPATPANERYDELRVHPAWGYHGRDVPSWEALWQQFARRVRRHRATTFVGVHFGNAPEEPDRVARLLDECPNLYIDTAARIPEIGRRDPQRMRAFFVRYQDRILFGTDLGVGPGHLMLGSSGAEEPGPADVRRFFRASWRYFETADRSFAHPTPIQGNWTIHGVALPPAVQRKVYATNAVRVFRLAVAGLGK